MGFRCSSWRDIRERVANRKCSIDILYYNLKGCSEGELVCYDSCCAVFLLSLVDFLMALKNLNFNRRRRINVSIQSYT